METFDDYRKKVLDEAHGVFASNLARYGPRQGPFQAPEIAVIDQADWMQSSPRFLHLVTEEVEKLDIVKAYINAIKEKEDKAARAEMFEMEKICKAQGTFSHGARFFSVLASIICDKAGRGAQSWFEEHTDAWMAPWREPKAWGEGRASRASRERGRLETANN